MPMDFPIPQLTGDVTMTVHWDPDQDPNTVLEITRPWWVFVQWNVSGAIAPALGGDWTLQINVESIGPGLEQTVATRTIPLSQVPPALNRVYNEWVQIPAGVITDEGVYRVVAVVTHTDTGGIPPVTLHDRMAGFHEGPMLQFYHFDI